MLCYPVASHQLPLQKARDQEIRLLAVLAQVGQVSIALGGVSSVAGVLPEVECSRERLSNRLTLYLELLPVWHAAWLWKHCPKETDPLSSSVVEIGKRVYVDNLD